MKNVSFRKNRIKRLIVPTLLIILLIAYIYPVIWMYLSSVRTMADFLQSPLGLPREWIFSNFTKAFIMADLGRHFIISLIVTCISTFFVVLFASLAAFSFSRLNYNGRKILYALFFLGLVLPVQSYLVGMFVEFKITGILDTFLSMILPLQAINLPIAVLLMKNYFDSLPAAMEESAIIDGANTFQIYLLIMMPLAKAIVITVITITAINVWNEFLIPFVMVHSDNLKPLTTSLYVFSTSHSSQITLKLAALTMVATPMFIVYFIFQKQIQKGITAGAIKS